MKPSWGRGPQACLPDSQALKEAYLCLDSDFTVVLKKLTKRDVTTIQKALEEFSTLCEEKDDYTLRAVLPFWPRLYNTLAIDVDRKVRRNTQKAMAALVGRVRGRLAPYLKDVMGMWILSCNDIDPIVAAAANSSFSAAFSPEKQTSAILFYKQAVLEYMTDNLMNHTPSYLYETTKKEDMEWEYFFITMAKLMGAHHLLPTWPRLEVDIEWMYWRVVSSSFMGLRHLLLSLSRSEVDDELKGHLHGMLSQTRFWYLAETRMSFLQASSFAVAKEEVLKACCGVFWFLSSACQVVPDVVVEYIGKINFLVWGNGNIIQPDLSNAMWDTVLSCVKFLPTCCKKISWQVTFSAMLNYVLENGCVGNAANVAPHFLPLFSCIPMEAVGGSTVFFSKVLELFVLGFAKDTVISSSSETYAWTRAFVECLQFAFKDISTSGGRASDDVLKVILLDHLLPVVEASLCAPKPALSQSVLYSFVSPFLKDLEANTDTSSLAADFWMQLSENLVKMLIMDFHKIWSLCLNRILVLFNGLLYPKEASGSGKGESKRVIFTAAEEEETGLQQSDGSVVEVCDGLKCLVRNVMAYSHWLYLKGRRSIYLKLFVDLASLYFPEDVAAFLLLFLHRVSESGEATSQGLADGMDYSTTCVYSKIIGLVVLPVLGGWEIEDELVEHTLTLLFVCLPHMTKESSTNVWGSVLQTVISTTVLRRLLEMALEKRQLIPKISDWLSSAHLNTRLCHLVAVITSQHFILPPKELEQGLKVICLIFSANDNSVGFPAEPVFPSSWIVDIVGIMGQHLTNLVSCLAEQEFQPVIQFVAKAALTFFQKLKLSLCINESRYMILALLMADLNSNLPVSGKEGSVLRQSWTTGLGLAVRETDCLYPGSILSSACQVIRATIATRVYTTEQYNKVIEVRELLKTTLHHLPKQNASDGDETHNLLLLELLTDLFVPSTVTSMTSAQINDVIFIHCLTSQVPITVLLPDIYPTAWCERTKRRTQCQSISSVVFSSMFNLDLLQCMGFGIQDTGCGDDAWWCSGEKMDFPPALWGNEDLEEQVMLSAVGSLCLASTWCKIQSKVPPELTNVVEDLKTTIHAWFLTASKTVQQSLISKAFASILENPHYCLAFTYLAELQCAQTGMIDQEYFKQLFHSSEWDLEQNGWRVEALVPFLPQYMATDLFQLRADLFNSLPNTADLQTATCVRVMTAVVSKRSAFLSSTYGDILQNIVIKLESTWKHDEYSEVSQTHHSMKQQAVLAVEVTIMQFLRTVMTSGVFKLTPNLWDVILCRLVFWVKNLDMLNVSLQSSAPSLAFCVETCRLVAAVAGIIHGPGVEQKEGICPPNLKTKWTDSFAAGIFSSLFPLFLKLANQLKKTEKVEGTAAVILGAVGLAISHCPQGQIAAHNLSLYLKPSDQALYFPESLQTVLNQLCPVLMNAFPSAQVAAFCILDKTVTLLPSCHEEQRAGATVSASASESDSDELNIRAPPAALMKVIDDCAIAMDVILTSVPMEATINLVPGTEEYQFALGYLLAWKLLFCLLHSADSVGHAKYASYLKDQCYVQHLLHHLFRLMPHTPASSLSGTSSTSSTPKLSSKGVESWSSSSDVNLTPDDVGGLRDIQQESCRLYVHCLRVIPLQVRRWWKDQDRKSAAYVSKFTMQNASQQLICSELEAVSSSGMKGTRVKTNPATRQVTSIYMTEEPEELQSEIQVTLPEDYPLGVITVVGNPHDYFKKGQWNKLLVQIYMFLQYQKGSITEGMRMWKQSIEKVEDVEQCCICFAVRYKKHFPTMPCPTCKKQFHTACLCRWLDIHVRRTCPFCRSEFA